jgi:nicotinamidase/pyrazinamidase
MKKKALIVVDAQYDFMPASEEDYKAGRGGALAVTDGDQIVPVINQLLPKFDLIIFTKDWHPEDMECFMTENGKNIMEEFTTSKGETDLAWPKHCVRDTRGSELHEGIDLGLIKGNFYIFKKGTEKDNHPYSGFGAEGLSEFLKERNVEKVVITGLATDYCVKDTALDAIKENLEVDLIWDGCRGIGEDLTELVNEFFDAGVNVTDLETYLLNNR